MDSQISVRVFDWRGEIWLAIDRVGRAPDRRYAPRTRLATFHAQPLRDVPESVAFLWLLEQLTAWVNAGCPSPSRAARSGAPQRGATGGETHGAPFGQAAENRLPSQTRPSAVKHSASVASTDGLTPPGEQMTIPGLPDGLR